MRLVGREKANNGRNNLMRGYWRVLGRQAEGGIRAARTRIVAKGNMVGRRMNMRLLGLVRYDFRTVLGPF